jgi:hypothetical protein
MRRIRKHFYRAGLKNGFGLDDAIAGITGLWPGNWGTGPYSHVELEFCDRWFNEPPFFSPLTRKGIYARGICFSSATRGGKTGVRFAPSSEILKHPERWDYHEETLPDDQEQQLFDECSKLIGAKYDYIGCFAKITPWTSWMQMVERWYCSEVVLYVLWLVKLLAKKLRWSPRAMSKLFGALRNLATCELI